MCGRFGLFPELDALAEQFNFDPSIMQDIYHPRWNIPPTASVLTIHNDSQESVSSKNSARLLRWGMAGTRSNKTSKVSRPLFNARAETVHKLPSFRDAFRSRRCLIPASGFYEWKKASSGKRTPMWFERKDNAPVAFAGIWSRERTPDGDIDSCAIITCAANNLVRPSIIECPSSSRRTPITNGSVNMRIPTSCSRCCKHRNGAKSRSIWYPTKSTAPPTTIRHSSSAQAMNYSLT